MYELSNFEAIEISLASPERIREWSSGEVKSGETINYNSLKPDKGGLFCERIFGQAIACHGSAVIAWLKISNLTDLEDLVWICGMT